MGDAPGDAPQNRHTTPRWVKVAGVIAIVLALVIAIVLLAGGGPGRHGPGRHLPGGNGTTPPPAIQGEVQAP